MTATPPPESSLARQLRADMEAISATTPAINRSAGAVGLALDLEREKERTRVLTNYVAYLITRVDQLES
jgi:hypothetical protein